MNITNITVKKIEGQKVLRGVASVVFDDELKIRQKRVGRRKFAVRSFKTHEI